MIDRRDTPTSARPRTSAGAADGPIVRQPPANVEAERAVLGSILLDGDSLGDLVGHLKAEDFYVPAHQVIFGVLLEMYDKGGQVDPMLLFDEIERQGIAADVGGSEFVAGLAHAVHTPAHVQHYARLVRERAVARSVLKVTAEIQEVAYAHEASGDELLEMAEARVFELGNRRGVSEAQDVRALLTQTFEELEHNDGPATGIQTGFYQFDEMTAGLRPGELIIVAARPSMGKTTLALNMAMNAAIQGGHKVAIFSLEMTAQNIVRNMLCAKARFPGHDLRRGRFLTDEKRQRLADAAGPLFDAGIYVDDAPVLNPTALRAKARRLKAKEGLDLILIDYLQLMEGGVMRRSIDNRQQEISYISRSLKGLARELQVPVVALSQLNRDAEKRPDNRPKLADLRESGAIEQDADVICLLYRKFYYSRQEADELDAELIIGKQRNGPTGTVRLHFFGDCMLFTNPSLQTGT